ncbi:reticulocyte binding protein 3 [Plasmodium cynomolgi strain B]|uniref:Reticulocyte binding protein 3 n=6 Tax=Plasmodium cynomolgi TaxID=5827 RepID=K6VIX0_PLACD|nr:reticulocyte binding protein 3 [Plasmodium cynomolgi strain B]GAB69337.1 reticulocyte binding protein 3 [Plasmodium cynomolgi strain B]
MKKNGWWGVSFGVLLFLIGASWENVINESNKHKKEETNSSINFYWGRKNESEYPGRKKKNLQKHSLSPGEEGYSKDSTPSGNNGNESGLFKKKALIHLRDSKFRRKPSRYAYIKSNNENNLDRHPSSSEKEAKNEPNGSPSSFLQNMNVPNIEEILDYFEIVGEKEGELIFSLEPYYVDIYTCKEIVRSINRKTLTNSSGTYGKEEENEDNDYNSGPIKDSRIRNLYHYMKLSVMHCNNEKINLLNRMNILEDPNIEVNERVSIGEKSTTYKLLINEYVNCLKEDNEDVKEKIEDAKKKITKEYEKKYCPNNKCNSNVYFESVHLYLSYVNNNADILYNSNINDAKEFLKSGTSIVNIIEKEIGSNNVINSIKFLQSEISSIINNYNYHIKNIKNAIYNIREHKKNDNSSDFDKKTLVDKSFDLVKNMSVYKYNNEMFNRMKALYDLKSAKCKELFTFLAEELKHKLNSFSETVTFQVKYNSIINDWKFILDYAKDIYNKNLTKIKNYEGNEGLEVILVRNKIKEKLATLEGLVDKLDNLFNIIKSKYAIVMSAKSLIGELMSEFKTGEKGDYKFDDLIGLMETISSKINTVNESVDSIHKTYSNIQYVEIQVENLSTSLDGYMNEIDDLKAKGSTNDYIREEMESKMLFITENINNLKKMLSLEEKANEYIAQIDELIVGTSLDMNEIINKKSDAYNKIKVIIKEIYEGNLKNFLDEMSLNVDKNSDSIYHSSSTDELDGVLNNIKDDYKKMKSIKCENIPDSLESIMNMLKIISDAKEEILKIQFGDINEKLTNSLEQLKSVYDKLKVSTAEYTAGKGKIEQCKTVILKGEKEFYDKEYDKDDDMLEVKNAYADFLKHKDNFLKDRSKVFEEFHIAKEALKTARIYLLSYVEVPEKYNIMNGEANEKYKELIKEIKNKVIDTKLKNYEADFNQNNKLSDSIIKEVEQSNKNLCNLKILNRSIKDCSMDSNIIEELINKNNSLKEEIISQRNEIEKDNFMEHHVKINLKIKFDDARITLGRNLYENNLTTLKTRMKNILDFYTSSKKKYKDLNEADLKKIKENEEWKNAKELIDTLNVEYEILKKQADDLISSKNSEIIKWIGNRIVDKNKEINEKVDEHVNSFDEIIAKSKSPIFVRDINHYKNDENKEKARQFNEEVKTFVVKIETQKEMLNKIKTNSNQYLAQANQKISENIEFKAKEEAMKEVYEQIIRASEELNDKLKKIPTLNDLQKMELKFEKNEIHDMFNQITTELKKSENEMNEINSYKHEIDEMKKAKSEEETPESPLFVYTEFYEKAEKSHSTIKELFNKATGLNVKCENIESVNEIKDIKKKIDGYLRNILTNNSTLHEALEDIKNMKEMLQDVNIHEIVRLVEKDATEAQKYSTLVKSEQDKSEALIKVLVKHFTDAEKLKTEMNKNLPIQRIDEIVKEVMKYKDEIARREEEMNTYLKNTKEYRDTAFRHCRNVYSRKKKLEYLKEKEKADEPQIDMDNVSMNENKCKTLEKDPALSEEEIKKHGNRYVEYEGKMNSLLNDISVLQIRTMYAKGKDQATNIMKEIEQLNKGIQEKLKESEEKLEQCKSKFQMNEKEYILNNEKSKTAYINVKLNLELVESNLCQIKNVKESVNNILSKSTNLKSSILRTSRIESDSSVDVLKKEEMHYMQYLKNIENEKKLMTDEKSNMDVIHKNVLKIENELEKCKKNYEQGILEKAKETADKKKKLIESTRESLNSLKPYFTEMFNESYLKGYNITENFIGYQKTMNELYDEFDKSYKVIETNAAKVAEGTVKYDKAKSLREEAQRAQININNKEETAKTNLNKIKQNEFMNFLFHTKEHVDKIEKVCEQENSKIGEVHENIKKNIIKIRKLTEQKSTFEILKIAKEKNNEIKKNLQKCNKNEAHNAFGKMIKASNFMGIKILTSLGSELSPEMHLETNSRTNSTLNFESEVEIKPEDDAKFNAYQNLQVTYGYIQKIFKNSEETDRKQEEIEGWIRQGNNKCQDIKSSNELKSKFKYTKYKGSITLYKINDALRKYTQLKAMTCSIVNDNEIMESSEFTKLKELSDVYNRKKNEQISESEINGVNDEFQGIMKNVESLEKQYETTQDTESPGEIIIEENSLVTEINKKIDSINSRITPIMTKLNELLVAGMACEKSSYASLIGNINAKTSSDLRLINNQKQDAEKNVEYIKKNSNLINDDIRALNKYFDNNRINNYQLIILEEAIKHANDLNAKEKEAVGIVNDIKKEFVDVSLELEMNSLNSSKEKIMGHYNKLKDKIKSINDFCKNINLVKLKEMESSSDKYLEIAGKFKNVLDTQITRLLDNHMMLQDIEKKITENEGKLKGISRTYTLQSIQKFNNVCKNIDINMQKLHEVEQSNNSEEKQVKACIENVSRLINRGNTLLTDLNDYDVVSHSTAKESTDDATKEYITKIKGKVNHTIEAFQMVLKSIQENKLHTQNNANLNKGIYEIWKRANVIKANFSENFPETDNYFQMGDYLKDIKNILNEIVGDTNIEAYIENISHNIEEQMNDTQNHRNVKSILKVKKNIELYNEEANKILQSMNTAQDKILLKKKDMDNIFSIISVNMKNSVYINTKKYINEVDDLFNKLKVDIHKMENFINDIKLRIKQLEKEEANLKTRNAVTGNLNEHSENASRDGDGEPIGEVVEDSEYSEDSNDNQNQRKRNGVSINSKGDSSNQSFHKVHGLKENNKSGGNHSDDNRKEESHNESNNSGGKNSWESYRYAGGITIAFFICSSAGFAIFTYNNQEAQEADFVADMDHFECDTYFNKREKEEIIEVSLNENEQYE